MLLHGSRVMYALNWIIVAPALFYIKTSLDVSVVELGFIVTSFFAGLSIFQLFGGYMSSIIGDKNATLISLLLMGMFSFLSGLSTNFSELLFSRFVAGIASAIFFSSALSLMVTVVPEKSYPFHVSLYNGIFSAGAGAGVILFAIIDKFYGYKSGFILVGAIIMVFFIVMLFSYRGTKNIRMEKNYIFKGLKTVLSSRLILFISLAGISARISEIVVGQFLVYYIEHLKYDSIISSFALTLFLIVGVIGGIIGGYHYLRTKHRIGTFIILNVLVSLLLIFTGFIFNIFIILIVMIIMGITIVYLFSITYTIVRNLSKRESVSLSLSYAHTIQLSFAAVIPIIFTLTYELYSYKISWIAMGIISLIFLLFIIPYVNGVEKTIWR